MHHSAGLVEGSGSERTEDESGEEEIAVRLELSNT